MKEDNVPCCEPEFWVCLLLSFILVSLAGLTSGLALGLLSFSKVDIEVLIKAAKVLRVVKNEHFLLCTLLIVKSMAMDALPFFLDSILPSWAAILVSVTLVIAFAEVIPQAVCARYGLTLGAMFSGLVRLLLIVLYPITCPISKVILVPQLLQNWELLDCLLGKGHSALLRRAELKTLVDLHTTEAGKGGDLSHHENTIISGALDLTQKTAKDAMTPISETFALDISSKLDIHTMSLITNKGHSRVPIYSGQPSNIVGLILVKNLIFCRPEDETPIKSLTIRSIPRVQEDWPLYNILNQFQKGHSHIAVVLKSKKDVKSTVNGVGEPTPLLDIMTDPDCKPTQAERKEIHSPVNQTQDGRIISMNGSSLYFSDTEVQNPTFKSEIEQDSNLHPQRKDCGGSIPHEGIQSLPSELDEEVVVGIITMEDVMEQLLQGEILDETDEYVNVHSKLTINPVPLRRSSSKSPGVASVSSHHWRTPEASPLSSSLRLPISPFLPTPLRRPTLSTSPGQSMRKPRTGFSGPLQSSPPSSN